MLHTLVPLRSQPPSVRVADVRTDARSDPLSGSLMPREKKHSPRQMAGRNRCRCASLP